jgi:tetratricopeptide (TPR) repeat protein
MLLLALAVGCMRTPAPPAADPWTASVFDQHAHADALIDRGAPGEARAALQRILDSAPARARSGDDPGRRALLRDTLFRLGRLELEAHQPAQALRHANEGLALDGAGDESADLFVANLLVLRGSALAALGDEAAALPDYERALRINEALLQQALP